MTDQSHLKPESRVLELNGMRLHHLEWGQPGNPPLILLHGIRLHAHCFNDFSRRFADKHHIIALDARGHGDSQWSEEGDYHLHTYYEDLKGIIEARGLKQVVLIGHSLGARTAMLYTHLHPEIVKRLVLIDMGAGLPKMITKKDFSRVTETPPPRDFGSPGEAADYLGNILKLAPKHMIEESAVHGLRKNEQGRFVWKYDPQLGGVPQPRAGVREWDLWEAIKTITCPTLLLHGEYSQVVSAEIAQRMGDEMADCRVRRVDQAGHALFTEQPEVFADQVRQFFNETGLT